MIKEILDRLEVDWNPVDLALLSMNWHLTTADDRLRYVNLHADNFEKHEHIMRSHRHPLDIET